MTDEKKTIKFGDLEIEVASQAECEKCDYVICSPASWGGQDWVALGFAPDLYAECSICKVRIRHRPHVPKTPPKICLLCLVELEKKNQV